MARLQPRRFAVVKIPKGGSQFVLMRRQRDGDRTQVTGFSFTMLPHFPKVYATSGGPLLGSGMAPPHLFMTDRPLFHEGPRGLDKTSEVGGSLAEVDFIYPSDFQGNSALLWGAITQAAHGVLRPKGVQIVAAVSKRATAQ